MKKSLIAAVSIAMLSFASAPAFADCADDVKKVKAAITQMPQSFRKQDALLKIQEAEAALARKDEAACKQAVQAADAIKG